jgi:hypothetical protein
MKLIIILYKPLALAPQETPGIFEDILFLVRFTIMKRKILFSIFLIGLVMMVYSQEREGGWRPRNMPEPENVTVSGNLIVAHGMPAIKSGDTTYIVSGISRLIGFVDGLKEGAQVSIEGIAFKMPRREDVKILRSGTMNLNGKTYDLAPNLMSQQGWGWRGCPMLQAMPQQRQWRNKVPGARAQN